MHQHTTRMAEQQQVSLIIRQGNAISELHRGMSELNFIINALTGRIEQLEKKASATPAPAAPAAAKPKRKVQKMGVAMRAILDNAPPGSKIYIPLLIEHIYGTDAAPKSAASVINNALRKLETRGLTEKVKGRNSVWQMAAAYPENY